MPKPKEYEAMTVEELDAELIRLDEERLDIRERARSVRRRRDTLLAQQQAARLADTLSDYQKAALAQHLALTGAGGGKAGAGGAR
jgi:phosphomevalonate kinase